MFVARNRSGGEIVASAFCVAGKIVEFPGLPGIKPACLKITVFHDEKSCYIDAPGRMATTSSRPLPRQSHRRLGSLIRAIGDVEAVRCTSSFA
jgi:hypothetical protein